MLFTYTVRFRKRFPTLPRFAVLRTFFSFPLGLRVLTITMPDSAPKRSLTSADDTQQPRPKRTVVRKRAALACEECRVRKRRCDSAIPACGGCTKRMVACVYSAELEAREWHQMYVLSIASTPFMKKLMVRVSLE